MQDQLLGLPLAIVTAILTGLISAVLSNVIVYYLGIKRLAREIRSNVQKERYVKTLDACQQFWKLLAYTTDTENPKSVILWEKKPNATTKTYYLHKENAERFIEALAETFYGGGFGLFLPKEIRPLLFEYRAIIFGALLSHKGEANGNIEKIPIKKQEAVDRLLKIHQEIINRLREASGLDNPILPHNLL